MLADLSTMCWLHSSFLFLDLFFLPHFEGYTALPFWNLHNFPSNQSVLFCGKALIKHLIASTSQKCVIPTETQKSMQLLPEDLSLLSATAAEKRALFQTHPPPPFPSFFSSACWKIRSPRPGYREKFLSNLKYVLVIFNNKYSMETQ